MFLLSSLLSVSSLWDLNGGAIATVKTWQNYAAGERGDHEMSGQVSQDGGKMV